MFRMPYRSSIFNFEAALLLACLLSGAACKRERKVRAESVQNAPGGLINVADPHAASRLVKGFYGTENPYWRWTARESSIILNPPRGAAQRGAVLVLNFAIVDLVLASLKSIDLSIAVGGFALPVHHYDKSGQFTLRLDIPAAALQFDPARVDFTLDHALPPSTIDPRELGMIVSQVGFDPK